MHLYNNFRKECLRHGRFDMTPYPCCALWNGIGNFTCKPYRQAIGIHGYIHGYTHGYIHGYIHGYAQKYVDMDVDMDGKFHIHGKPGNDW